MGVKRGTSGKVREREISDEVPSSKRLREDSPLDNGHDEEDTEGLAVLEDRDDILPDEENSQLKNTTPDSASTYVFSLDASIC